MICPQEETSQRNGNLKCIGYYKVKKKFKFDEYR